MKKWENEQVLLAIKTSYGKPIIMQAIWFDEGTMVPNMEEIKLCNSLLLAKQKRLREFTKKGMLVLWLIVTP